MNAVKPISLSPHRILARPIPVASSDATPCSPTLLIGPQHSFSSLRLSRRHRSSLAFAGASYWLATLRPCRDGGISRVASFPGRIKRKTNIVAVTRVPEGIAESVETGSMSYEELKTQSDTYFLTDTRPIILFDGVCNMCNGGVNFMLENDPEGKVRFAALQSAAGRSLLVRSGRAPNDISSIVLIDKNRAYIRSEAILQTAQYLGFPYPHLAFLAFAVPLFLRDIFYDIVADNRYSVFGKTHECRLSDPQFEQRFIE